MPAPIRHIDPELKTYASERQGQYIDAINKHGGFRAAAKALGINESNLSMAMQRVRRNAALRGYSPDHDMTRTVPETHVAKGVSTLYDAEGKVRAQWVKSTLDEKQAEAAKRAALEALAEDLPRVEPIAPPTQSLAALCNVYTLTDCHVGMLAWSKETGADWDLKIAESTLCRAFAQMIATAPRSSVAFVNQLGDFLHYDGQLPVTPTSGHVLDADGRFELMVKTAIRILRRIVDMALANHERVIVLLAEGNHDMASSVWLRHLFAALYEREPRVQVMQSPLPYYAHQHGETMIGFHHSHLTKHASLPLLMAAQFPAIWGATRHRVVHTGHLHHTHIKEHDGITVEQHTTLAARDAHSARSGYVSTRAARAITYHERHGEVARVTVTPEMLDEVNPPPVPALAAL